MSPVQHGGNAQAIARKLGLTSCPPVAVDFSVNLNPLGPPPVVQRVLMQGHATIARYPEEFADTAVQALAAAHGVSPATVVLGNGSTEIFGWILQALQPRGAGCVAPCYGGYREVCEAHGTPLSCVHTLTCDNGFRLTHPFAVPDETGVLFVGSPNNPTGSRVRPEILFSLAERNPHATIVIDASFMDFVEPPQAEDMPENVVVVKSLTKCFCIPGLRLGMAWGAPVVMDRVKTVRLPWSVNGLAQSVALHLYSDERYLEQSRLETRRLRERFAAAIGELPGFEVFPADADYLLVGLPAEWPVERLQRALLGEGLLIRSCEDFDGLDAAYCRLAVRPESEQDRLVRALATLLGGQQEHKITVTAKPPAIMVVGTTSNAGKSIVAAGLCRLLARRGLRVAPFKAQNMSLNSYVTAEGGEMGRAQVTQAYAAGVRPHTDMNPVLLKPLGENGSQVIVDGKPIGNFKAREYYAMKQRVRGAAHAAYDRLSSRYDCIVLEGAGSPAEINLMAEDFVNMAMAEYAGAKTVLVADIDRGGVFATILGTVNLLPAHFRRLLAGIIINKFRGDVSLLDAGIRDIEAMTGVPVLGVLPYLPDLRIEDEDSLGIEGKRYDGAAVLDVAVIRLPRISNFTDFLAMECDSGVKVRYVDRIDALGQPDLIVLPGTKNTRSDLGWLHDSGMAASIGGLRATGVPVIGICGGFQMLGAEVVDDQGVEGEAGTTPGLGLLHVATRLLPHKELAQVSGATADAWPFGGAGTEFHGYEIHAGVTALPGGAAAPLTVTARSESGANEPAGAVSADGTVFGCYIHGLFDSPGIRQALWRHLCRRKGTGEDAVSVAERNASTEFDRLADRLEAHVRLNGLIDAQSALCQ